MQDIKQIQKIYNLLTFYDRYNDVIKCWAKNSKKIKIVAESQN